MNSIEVDQSMGTFAQSSSPPFWASFTVPSSGPRSLVRTFEPPRRPWGGRFRSREASAAAPGGRWQGHGRKRPPRGRIAPCSPHRRRFVLDELAFGVEQVQAGAGVDPDFLAPVVNGQGSGSGEAGELGIAAGIVGMQQVDGGWVGGPDSGRVGYGVMESTAPRGATIPARKPRAKTKRIKDRPLLN